jgi:hypothetical protein
MKSAKERLQWLINFATDYNPKLGLKDWERLKLQEEIRAFIGESLASLNFVVQSEGEPQRLSDLEITDRVITRLWVRGKTLMHKITGSDVPLKYLAEYVDQHRVSVPSPTIDRFMKQPEGMQIDDEALQRELQRFQIPLVLVCSPEPWNIEVRASLEDLFSLRCMLDFYSEGAHIARCPAPECHRPFYRNTLKQEYCSKRCINRVTRRKWLEKAENKAKEAEQARERYARRTKLKTGKEPRRRARKIAPGD